MQVYETYKNYMKTHKQKLDEFTVNGQPPA